MARMRLRLGTIVATIALAAAYFQSPVGSTQSVPVPDILNAEGGGSYIPGSYVELASGTQSARFFSWKLVGFETTEYPCIRLVFLTFPGGVELGSSGGCGGITDPAQTMPVSSGYVVDTGLALTHHGAFGWRVPVGTALIKAILSDGSSVVSPPAVSGAWVALWDGSPVLSEVQAVSATGAIIFRCQSDCSEQ